MISPHIKNGDTYETVIAWVVCEKCNNAKHRMLPGEKAPFWWCQDTRCQLVEGQEIEVEDLE